MQDERWLPIPGWDRYLVSDQGRMMGLRGQVRRLDQLPDGYLRVGLYVDGRCVNRLVHVLVALAFLGPKPEGMQVNHKDGVKSNNRVDNLEYVTPSENIRHAHQVLGVRRARGSENGWSKVTEQAVRDIRTRHKSAGLKQLASEHGIHPSTVHRIATRQIWAHVT